MGVLTNCKVSFYSQDRLFINKYNLDGRADDFIYHLIDGSRFEPYQLGKFSKEEMKIMKVYFDKESSSVAEGYAKVTANIQDPRKLLEIWITIRTELIKTFYEHFKLFKRDMLGTVETLKSKIDEVNNAKLFFFNQNKIEFPFQLIFMDERKFDKMMSEYTWSLDSISKIIGALEIAIKNEYLVEITVSDW